MECAVCLLEMTAPTVVLQPCCHHFCLGCVDEFLRQDSRCPRCRRQVFQVACDTDFDCLLRNAAPGHTPKAVHDSPIVLRFEREACVSAGLTVRNRLGIGVQICKIDRKGLGYRCGLRKGDVIVSMNRVPCRHHRHAIDMIQEAMFAGCPLQWTVDSGRRQPGASVLERVSRS